MSLNTAALPVVAPARSPLPPVRGAGDAPPAGRARVRVPVVVVLGLLVALGPFTTDLYLPAFPAVQADLHVSAVAIQLTLSGTVAGFALGQLVIGPWSDRVGRRLPLLVAVSLHVATCLAAAFAPDVRVLAVLRLLQGVGASGGAVVAAAMVRDLYAGRRLIAMLARMGLVSGAAPIVAPLVGSQLLVLLDWRGLFVCLAGYGAAGLALATLAIGETRPRERRASAPRRSLRDRYRAVFTDRVFVGAMICGGMQFAGVFAYLSVSPFLLQQVYGLTPQQYGLVFAGNSVGLLVAAQCSARISARFGAQWVLTAAVGLQLAAGIALVAGATEGAPLPALLVPLCLFMTAFGLGMPTVQVLALAHHGEEAGTAASLIGAGNFGTGALVAPLVGLLGSHAGSSVGVVVTTACVIAAGALVVLVRPASVPALA